MNLAERIAIAFDLNVVHRWLGTRLERVGPGEVVIALDWPTNRLGPPGADGWPHSVLGALLDHSAALAGLAMLDDPTRIGGTMNLRVDYLHPAAPDRPLVARGSCGHALDHLAYARSEVFHPGAEHSPVAVAVATMGVLPVGRA